MDFYGIFLTSASLIMSRKIQARIYRLLELRSSEERSASAQSKAPAASSLLAAARSG